VNKIAKDEEIRMNNGELNIRYADEKDIPLILSFIRELAEYEHLSDQVIATEEILKDGLFIQKKAEVIIGETCDSPVGFALFFHNFSTFLGRPGIYLEDLFVRPEYRGSGYGKSLLKKVAEIAVKRGCGRLEWSCLNWNKPSIEFYLKMQAQPMNDWTVYRVTGEILDQLAK
jgi:GNAT superfamily N-acetyltransferase